MTVLNLTRPGQSCGSCVLKRPLPKPDSYFTGECGAITGRDGKPCLAPVVDYSGTDCRFYRPRAAPRGQGEGA